MLKTFELEEMMAGRFLRLTMGHLTREWPYKLDQVLTSRHDLRAPRELHPIFHGSFDWHSCVHGWWQVMRLRRLHPALPEAEAAADLADRMLTRAKAEGERAGFDRPMAGTFERPYGWAWLLALHDELGRHPSQAWAAALAPLAETIAEHFAAYLPRLAWPVRSGNHGNTAFALVHALRWARRHDARLAAMIETCACEWFANDRAARPWEPGGEDFLSPTLCEAVLMQELGGHRNGWLQAFLPDPFGADAMVLVQPVEVADRTDGRLAHLDGLNLSRAWCWRVLAPSLPDPSAIKAVAARHLAASMPHLADDYMGEHWLATFAVLALTVSEDNGAS